MAVSCEMCGLPTEEPVLRTKDGENFYLCVECSYICRACDGEGTVNGVKCLKCDGKGQNAPEPEEEENGYWGW